MYMEDKIEFKFDEFSNMIGGLTMKYAIKAATLVLEDTFATY